MSVVCGEIRVKSNVRVYLLEAIGVSERCLTPGSVKREARFPVMPRDMHAQKKA